MSETAVFYMSIAVSQYVMIDYFFHFFFKLVNRYEKK